MIVLLSLVRSSGWLPFGVHRAANCPVEPPFEVYVFFGRDLRCFRTPCIFFFGLVLVLVNVYICRHLNNKVLGINDALFVVLYMLYLWYPNSDCLVAAVVSFW